MLSKHFQVKEGSQFADLLIWSCNFDEVFRIFVLCFELFL